MEPQEDFLDSDTQIPGQTYTLLSFVSPEKILRSKELWMQQKFLETFIKNYDLKYKDFESKYKDFLYINSEKLEEQFHTENDFKTTVRGVKVRGTYANMKEAQFRAKKLQKLDPNFNVFIGQVGFWLPWDPDTLQIDDQEYAEGELNNLVKKYRENKDATDTHFSENVQYAKDQAQAATQKSVEAAASDSTAITDVEDVEEIVNEGLPVSETAQAVPQTELSSLEAVDPWLARKSA